MRLLCTSDLHYRLPQLDWLASVVTDDDIDVLVVPGDFLQVVGSAPLEVQVVVVTKYLERFAEHAVVLASSGNHDLDGPDGHGEQWASWLQRARVPGVYVDGDTVDRDGVRFTVCPWWDGPRSRDALDAQLAAAAADRPARWVWVYHSPPAGTRLCTTGSRTFPDEDLAAWIERWQPDVVICGHIHQAPWANGGGWADRLGDTWVFNAGHVPAAMPSHIVVDLDAMTAEWTAIPDREAIDLRTGNRI